ncbi:MAG: ATP-binding cassette domain-containing protein, partial [Solirubrobacterales bacterium]|nr:ATP-binding cassette domain-containing protein [Solirubrobacterales bacterium]
MATGEQLGSAEPETPSEDAPAGRTAPSSALELRQLTKHFGDVVAVDNVDLTVDGGSYIVLLGPSGCGKTTILRMVGGHEHPTSGNIFLDGRSLLGIPSA